MCLKYFQYDNNTNNKINFIIFMIIIIIVWGIISSFILFFHLLSFFALLCILIGALSIIGRILCYYYADYRDNEVY